MTTPEPNGGHDPRITRRGLLLGALGAAGAAAAGASLYLRRDDGPEAAALARLGDEGGQRAAVFVVRAQDYDEALAAKILEGLQEVGVTRERIKGKNVLLKPNLVETKPDNPHINTNPVLLVAVAEAFRRLDAAEVAVAEGQGHRRDSWLVLEEAGYVERFQAAGLDYTDLNHDDVFTLENAGGLTGLSRLVLPRTLQWADVLVSVAKMKTHHWMGCTLSLKNMFGIMPGIYYGWPKNVLHYRGINESIVDINLTRRTDVQIVDGIVGLEGDGPINGTPRHVGAVLIGCSPAAVDATGARIMNLRVDRVGCQPGRNRPGYLEYASQRGLGPIRARHIEQRGASVAEVQSNFAVLDDVPWLKALKDPLGAG